MQKWLAKHIPLRSFDRNTRLFITATVIDGVIFSAVQLFYNFFILSRGFDRDFLGVLNSMPSIAALLLGIPLGVLSDKIGRRKAMLIGLFFQTSGMALTLMAQPKWLLIVGSLIYGAGNTLYMISHAPFMMSVTSRENRALLFSLNYGLQTLSGAAGSFIAGRLPAAIAPALGVAIGSTAVYRTILLMAVFVGAASLVPIFLIKELPKAAEDKPKSNSFTQLLEMFKHPLIWKLATPNLIIGFGAAILIPYMNLFFAYNHNLPEKDIGALFSLSSLIMGIGAVAGPVLEKRLGGKIRTIVATQASSIIFLILLGFSPLSWLAQIAFLARGVLMNIATPFYSAFAMEQIPPESQGAVNSMLNISWTLGWAVGPMLSGIVQQRAGFTPLFIATTIIYSGAIMMTWYFFHNSEQKVKKVEGNVEAALE